MPNLPQKKASSAESLATIANVLLAAFVIAVLYFGRELLVPIALATLLTFMCAPMVSRLQRWIGRIGAVLCVVAMICAATLGAGWILTRQAVDLASQLPNYKENISVKLRSIQIPEKGPLSRVSETLEDLKKDLPGAENSLSSKASAATNQPEPAPVRIVSGKDERVELMQVMLAPVLGPLGTASLVLLLLVFMLLQREDLRNRFIRLIGQGRISATTRAMDDAGSRVSKYLVMQLVVNVTYGIPVAIGLYFIGVPNAILWGALATVLRFIPYVGPWVAAAFPVLLSLTVSPSWMPPLLTIGLFIVLEILSNNVMEPWLYGSSTGVTPIALIVAALFWTWLWGPVGLVLATPLTVCLVVIGRHTPRLAFLSVALSDEEPLTPAEDFYQRIHRAGDHEGMELVDTYLKANPPGALFDSVLIPVISSSERDHRLGILESEQIEFIHTGLRDVLDELELRTIQPEGADTMGAPSICCIPAKALRDELAGDMLVQLLQQSGHAASNASSRMTSGELAGWVEDILPHVVCISVVSPSTATHARYLCTKLRASVPDLKIVVGMWGDAEDAAAATKVLRESGADEVLSTVTEAATRIAALVPLPASINPAA
ncbi:MAG: AI-2E family transporter [Verrucomicrobiaceae bacterium]|nr:MAG: AI-2E family transporter [Verrucomicrobiaceae bacterium]